MVEASYREITPHPALQSRVECYWIARGASPAFRVLPDGCVDFLFDAGGGGSARLVGAMTQPVEVAAAASRDVVAVRFRPGGAVPFVDAPLDRFTDDAVDLCRIGGAWGELGKVVLDGVSPRDRVTILERWLLERAAAAPGDALDGVLRRFAAGPCRVDRAALALGTSRQWFARAVRQRTGLSPKLLARVLRVRRLLADRRRVSMALLAQQHG